MQVFARTKIFDMYPQDAGKTDSGPLLELHSLRCERDDRLLFSDLDLQLNAGEVVQIRGGNGSGKTTLLRILCGLNTSFEGEVDWFPGSDMASQQDLFRQLLYIGHRVGVNKTLTPLENLRWSCGLHRPVSDARLIEALTDFGLSGFEESQCFTLSAGQQQRVSLSRLLVSDARVWILDEPFTTLDVHGVARLESLLGEQALAGGAVLVTTHHPLNVPNLKVLELGR